MKKSENLLNKNNREFNNQNQLCNRKSQKKFPQTNYS